jgi:hypothetical protein
MKQSEPTSEASFLSWWPDTEIHVLPSHAESAIAVFPSQAEMKELVFPSLLVHSIQPSLSYSNQSLNGNGCGNYWLCPSPRFFGFNVNRGKLKRWGIWESFSSAYQRQRVRCCLISFVISLLFPAASRKQLLGILVCFLSSVPWDRSLVLQLFTWFSSRNLGSISPIPGVFCFGMPKS